LIVENKSLRVLIVDDTAVYRKVVTEVLSELPEIEVVGTANNGKIAMSKIASLKPDLLTLDIEMPEMNGLDVLSAIKSYGYDVGAIVLSTLTHKGGELTMQALDLGAFDFITKPESNSIEESKKQIKNALSSMLKAYSRRLEIKNILGGRLSFINNIKESKTRETPESPHGVVRRMNSIVNSKKKTAEIVGIGVSTGGPKALSQMMPQLPADINVPILIVQHMPPIFTQSLAKSLNAKCAIDVKEAVDGETVRPNVAFIAPGGKQMKIVAGMDGKDRIIRITDDPPENSCKPSVDYLFRSIAQHYVGRSAGVIMTGMGSDGNIGLELMKRNGATIIAQDESTCIVYGMPKKAIESGVADIVAPLDRIAPEICQLVKGSPC
jgi:two-component system, chemotaxis family, protein-glutamate methylesterase/glutaminase